MWLSFWPQSWQSQTVPILMSWHNNTINAFSPNVVVQDFNSNYTTWPMMTTRHDNKLYNCLFLMSTKSNTIFQNYTNMLGSSNVCIYCSQHNLQNDLWCTQQWQQKPEGADGGFKMRWNALTWPASPAFYRWQEGWRKRHCFWAMATCKQSKIEDKCHWGSVCNARRRSNWRHDHMTDGYPSCWRMTNDRLAKFSKMPTLNI